MMGSGHHHWQPIECPCRFASSNAASRLVSGTKIRNDYWPKRPLIGRLLGKTTKVEL